MRILFYLPVVTPWWFDNIVGPLIARLAAVAEVHVIVPPLWSGTGIGAEQLLPLADAAGINWHIVDGDDHPALRDGSKDCPEIVELANAIAPDHVLCRAADMALPARFPGQVHYLMEAGAPPFPTADNWVMFQPALFDHGCLPALEDRSRQALATAIAPAWEMLRSHYPDADDWRTRMGLPEDRIIVALPLEYEHEENFFGRYRRHPRNHELVASLAEELGPEFFLAVTDHPLNALYGDSSDLDATLAAIPDRAKLVTANGVPGGPTALLARHGAGMILENSKSFGTGAFFGTPMLRFSRFETGAWMRAHQDLGGFAESLRAGERRGAGEADARLWFAFHIANNVVDPTDPEVDGQEIVARLERPVDPARWETGFRRYAAFAPELFAC